MPDMLLFYGSNINVQLLNDGMEHSDSDMKTDEVDNCNNAGSNASINALTTKEPEPNKEVSFL